MTKKIEASELTTEELESVQGGNGPNFEKKSLFDARFPYVDPSKQG